MVDSQIGRETYEDAKCSPHLPTHNQTSSDRCGAAFSGEDGDCRRFAAHANSHKNSSNKELVPSLADRGANNGEQTENGGYEDRPAAAKIIVERVRPPDTDDGSRVIRSRVDETNDPWVNTS